MTEAAKPAGWLDEKGEFHRSPQFHFLGLVDESCGSRDHIWSGTSLAEAGEAWKRFVVQGSKDVDLTGWNCGIIADHRLMSRQLTEATGTFACPICEKDTPHQHSAEAVAFHRDNEKWLQENHAKAWAEVERRVAALAERYPPRTPLYAIPPTSGVALPAKPHQLERVALPPMPLPVVKHEKLGDLFDRFAMHSYAMRYLMDCEKAASGVSPSAEVSHMQHIIEELAMLRRGMERLQKSPGKDECLKHLAYVERAVARGVRASDGRNWDGWDEWEAELTGFLSQLANRTDEIGKRADGLGQFLPELRVAFARRKTSDGVKACVPALLVTVCEMRDGDGLMHCAMLHHANQRAVDGMCVERRADRAEVEAEAAEWREFLTLGVALGEQ